MFTPQRKTRGQEDRGATTITVIVGTDRKSKFVEYCKKHDIGQTEMLKQMIDYCVEEKS